MREVLSACLAHFLSSFFFLLDYLLRLWFLRLQLLLIHLLLRLCDLLHLPLSLRLHVVVLSIRSILTSLRFARAILILRSSTFLCFLTAAPLRLGVGVHHFNLLRLFLHFLHELNLLLLKLLNLCKRVILLLLLLTSILLGTSQCIWPGLLFCELWRHAALFWVLHVDVVEKACLTAEHFLARHAFIHWGYWLSRGLLKVDR